MIGFTGNLRIAKIINNEDPNVASDSYTWFHYFPDEDRDPLLNDGWDHFVRGVCIFCNDALFSCAAHDGLHAMRRLSSDSPDPNFPGRRGRAIPCLYNHFLLDLWVSYDTPRSLYCSPYIGWWDNTGEHLHLEMNQRAGFFDGDAYGVCAYTKIKMGIIIF